jgi:hypothetical protein
VILSPSIRYELISTIRREQVAKAIARAQYETPTPRRRWRWRSRHRALTVAGSSPRGAGAPNTDLKRV